MNKQMKPDRSLLQFMLRAQQQLARHNAQSSNKGYVMMLTSIITILMFSMLGAYLTMTNLNKSAVAAYADSNNTFYAAESALNKRAAMVAAKFDAYGTPTGDGLGKTAANISTCFPMGIKSTPTAATSLKAADDFECLNFPSASSSSSNTVYQSLDDTSNGSSSWGGSGTYTTKTEKNNYLAYTFVADTTSYSIAPVAPTVANPAGTPGTPNPKVVPAGEDYAGLNVQEYKYTVYATAAKQNPDTTQTVNNTDAKTVLQMDFKSRVIPLFQFAAFYDGDLELHSGTAMDIGGRVHTNSNLYIQPISSNPTTFTSSLTAAGGVFRRVDVAAGSGTLGAARLQLTPPVGGTAGTYLNFPTSTSAYLVPTPINLTAATIPSQLTPTTNTTLSAANSAIFKTRVKDKAAGIVPLTVPSAGFLRKRNYYKSATAGTDTAKQQQAVGEYWAKADMRLELVPDRDAVGADGVTPLTATQGATAIAGGTRWNRNEAIIPFNFTSIQAATGTSSCMVTPPAANTDPDPKYVDSQRNGAVNPSTGEVLLQCNVFTKGQLQSLRQPVMVLTAINQPDTSIDHTNVAISGSESKTLGKPAVLPTLPTALSIAASNDNTKKKILRALQVAISSTPSPLPLDLLNVNFSDTSAANYGGANASLFAAEFNRLLLAIPELTPADRTLLGTTGSPNAVAALRNAWFLPAPIQRLASNQDTNTGRANTNIRSSGFYDSRERRWITMLQTNIKSLTVWNRDGLYVDADNETMTAPYTASPAKKDLAFNTGIGANFTDGRAFIRGAADAAQPAGTFKRLGLGSNNATEAGLVFHATVSDDLNGDGVLGDVTTINIDGTPSVNGSTNAIPYDRDILGNIKYVKKPDGTNKLDSAGNPIPYTLDYHRKYWSGPARQSPFGFAFNDGDLLPAPMNITTDQAIYIQGNFNNNTVLSNNTPRQTTVSTNIIPPDPNRLPAAIMADTITILSNECVATNSAVSEINHLGVLAGQIRCGLPRAANGSIDLTVGTNTANSYGVTGPMAVNAAFLSYTDRSAGNCTNITSDNTYKCGTAVANPRRASGGLNNYIRMLEDWQVTGSAQYFNYSGSFVSLGTPVEYSGFWVNNGTISGNGGNINNTNDYYMIPSRNYNFDPNFTIFSKLPPMTPSVRYLQQEVFKRTFN